MTNRLLRLDRGASFVLGLLLVAGGLLAADWQHRFLLDGYADPVDVAPVSDVVDTGWFPWVAAVVGVVLGLLGLMWLLAHLRHSGPSTLRLSASDETGRLEADLRSVASALADRLGTLAPLAGVSGTTRTHRGRTVVELRGQVDAGADPQAITEAVEQCTSELAQAFPSDDVTCRVVLDAPRRTRVRRTDRVRVS